MIVSLDAAAAKDYGRDMRSTVTLYRAADSSTAASGACFAADESDAATYLDNPGYGGASLHALTIAVESDAVLSLVDSRRNGVPHGRMATGAWTRLADAIGADVDALRDGNESVERAIDGRRVRAALAAAGYEWVVYEDTFPAACVTWVYLGGGILSLSAVTE